MKYDWARLKQAYISGDISNLKDFFVKEYGESSPLVKYNAYYEKSKDWKDEREKYLEDKYEKIRQETEKIQERDAIERVEELRPVMKQVTGLLKEYFSEGNAWEYVDYKDPNGEIKKRVKLLISPAEFKNMWQIVKTEIGEPTAVPTKETKQVKNQIPTVGLFGIKSLIEASKKVNDAPERIKADTGEVC